MTYNIHREVKGRIRRPQLYHISCIYRVCSLIKWDWLSCIRGRVNGDEWQAGFKTKYLSSAQKFGYREKVNMREGREAVNISGESKTQGGMHVWIALMQHITPAVRYGCPHCEPVNQTEGFHIPQEHVLAYSLLPGNNILLSPFKMCSPFRV